MAKKLHIIQLNEINFDEAYSFAQKHDLRNIIDFFSDYKTCKTEDKYELLEPWIQWPSFYLGKGYSDHGIFKIGDNNKSKNLNFIEGLSDQLKIGTFFSMNLPFVKNVKSFIPDPWSSSDPLINKYDKFIHKTLSKFINNNTSSKIRMHDYINLIFILFKFFKIKNLFTYLHLISKSLKFRYYKAIFLDFFSIQIYKKYLSTQNFDLSMLFLNGGAHIQHHYLLHFDLSNNINDDPYSKYLKELDTLLHEFKNFKKDSLLIISGLSQKTIEKPLYYYRLKNHDNFLKSLKLRYKKIQTLMSRDFKIFFENKNDMQKCMNQLANLKCSNDIKLFGEFKIIEDTILFLSSTYPNKIIDNYFIYNEKKFFLADFFNFVAIKNSVHSEDCYYSSFGDFNESLKDANINNIADFKKVIINYFND
jgi:hypothetical protein